MRALIDLMIVGGMAALAGGVYLEFGAGYAAISGGVLLLTFGTALAIADK